MQTQGNEFEISVIMAVYNTAEYLKAAIDSIIDQTIGFKEHIQLILINDGSTDNSGEICREYQKQYPHNIEYEEKKNGGAASARNAGRKYVKGKYLNFFDSDDIWTAESFKNAYDFFEAHYDEIDVLTCRMGYVGKQVGFDHPLDYKYQKGNRIIDLREEYTAVQAGNGNVFFKTEAIEGLVYDTGLLVAEDAMFIGQVSMEKEKHGVVASAVYQYRKREDGTSVSDWCRKKKTWYLDVPEKYYKRIIQMSKERVGSVPLFIQYMMMYDIQWRIVPNAIDEVLSENEKAQYTEQIRSVLQDIDDEVIYKLKKRRFSDKVFWLNLKYGKNVLNEAVLLKDGTFEYNGKKVFNARLRNRCLVRIIEVENERMTLEGDTDLILLGQKYRIDAEDQDGNLYPFELAPYAAKDMVAFNGEVVLKGTSFKVCVPITGRSRIRFVLTGPEGMKVTLKPGFLGFSGIHHELKNSYCVKKPYIIKLIKNAVCVYRFSAKTHLVSELRLWKGLLKQKRRAVIFRRLGYYLSKPFFRKPIWIVRDRHNRTGENGEQLFKYLSTWEGRKKYNLFFMLERDSPDYERVSKYGKILDPREPKYLRKFLLSSKIIDSMAVASAVNPFKDDRKYYQDLLNFDYIFLAHGIAQRDMSFWTHKLNYNIKIHITGVRREWEAVLKEPNGYTEKEVKLTGLPRYDELKSEPEKKIIFMPTWRNNLAGEIIYGTTEREYVPDFRESEYFKFYNTLINDPRLLETMKKSGYKGEFFNHPAFEKQAKDFTDNDVITVAKESANITRELSIASMLITDYSSVAFEFAYLKKPVIYCQFDSEHFVRQHTGSEGYFDYETDSFGPVCFDYESSIKHIIEIIERQCTVEPEYLHRVEDFFTFMDGKNSARVVEEILKLDEGKNL